MTCTRAQEFLAQADAKVKEEVNATAKLGAKDALKIARQASRVIVSKGKKRTTFQMKDKPTDKDLLGAMLGPTGNLRAPTMIRGKTVFVGFPADGFEELG